MINIKNLCYRHGRNIILQNVNASFNTGCITAILGTNGAGKSTLLHCIAGSATPSSGSVSLDGIPLPNFCLQQLAQRRAVLTQATVIGFPFTVLDIVLMGRTPYAGSTSTEQDMEAALSTLEFVDATHLKDRIFTSLSGGEQQRVHIARVLAQIWQKTDTYLLLDEPTSALDLKHQFRLMQFLRSYADSFNTTMVMVLHDLNLAYHYTDYTLFIINEHQHLFGKSKHTINAKNVSDIYGIPLQNSLMHLTGICVRNP